MTYSKNQLDWAQKIVNRVKSYKGLTEDEKQRIADIALETAMVETNLTMYANGNNPASLKLPHDAVGWDHGSVGLFQQQVGGAVNSTANWGTVSELMDAGISTDRFVNRLRSFDWKSYTNGAAAQKVQGSAFPDRYAQRDAEAIALRKQLWGKSTATVSAPKPAPTGPSTAKPAKPVKASYVVKAGDTLSKIAARFKTTWQALAKTNKLSNPNFITPGQKLIIGGVGPTGEVSSAYYTVEKNDNLTLIASRFGTTVDKLVALNGIKDKNVIQIGQRLRVH